MSEVIIDVRERDEYELEHIEHSINVPLSSFSTVVPGVLPNLKIEKLSLRVVAAYVHNKHLSKLKGLASMTAIVTVFMMEAS